MVRCSDCEEVLPCEGEYVKCGSCPRKLHFECTTISVRTYKAMSSIQKESWKCQFCRKSKDSRGKDNQGQMESLGTSGGESGALSTRSRKGSTIEAGNEVENDIKDIKRILKEHMNSVNFISENYDNINKTLESNNKILKNLSEEIVELKNQINIKNKTITTMERKINFLEEQVIANNIEIKNIPMQLEENETNIVKQVGQIVDFKIEDADINNIYRINNKNKEDSKIIVSFTTNILKNKFIKKVHSHGPINLFDLNKKLPSSTPKFKQNLKIYINNQLTATNRQIMWHTKNRAKECGWKFVWSRDGKILARKNETSSVVRIESTEDVSKII